MKKSLLLLIYLSIITGCNNPGGRSWMIPVTIDPSDLVYTPVQMESFELRRSQLIDSLDGARVILRSWDPGSYNRHEFRANNYFYYLTGYEATRTYALLSPDSEHPFTLSLPPRSIRTLIYEGGETTFEEIQELYHPDKMVEFREFYALMDSILQLEGIVYIDRSDRTFVADLKRRAGENSAVKFRDLGSLVDEMRVIKGSMEVERLQKACNITSKALTNVMRRCKAGMYEFEMESVIEGTFLEYGSAMPGFPSIVGSGPNSTILHYEPNTRIMEDGDLLLMDIGAEYGYYTADITRTIPVNGKFSPEQLTIYQLVLDAQIAAIEMMKPDRGYNEGHMAACKVIAEGLTELGLITDPESSWQILFYVLYPSSHYLGMDVHDVGDMGGSFSQFLEGSTNDSNKGRMLEPGMVLTIEPGLYFREKGLEQIYEIFEGKADSTELAAFVETVAPVYEQYLNIGVRIEDDILITKTGNIILSRYAPKEVEDIEQIMR